MTLEEYKEFLQAQEDIYDRAAERYRQDALKAVSPGMVRHLTNWRNYYNGKANAFHAARVKLLEVR